MRALITGAASGIGLAAAERLNADTLTREGKGAQLALVDINAEALEKVAAELRAEGAEIVSLVGDLGDPETPAQVVGQAVTALGGIDALVSNAGILKPGSLLELSLDDYEKTFAVNTRATWLLVRAAFPHLRDAGGSIVITASIAAHHPIPSQGAYSPSKAAVLMMMRQLACELGPAGIRVNSVSPGSTLTGIAGASRIDPRVTQPGGAPGRNPLGFISEPRDQAAMIAYLIGPDARFITGTDFPVDGGVQTQLMVKSGHPLSGPAAASS
jgi:NAD(P)-dependent dehydrogenase (short-subunit alcohol dehydrogenase family)